jgi:hypothetical protein
MASWIVSRWGQLLGALAVVSGCSATSGTGSTTSEPNPNGGAGAGAGGSSSQPTSGAPAQAGSLNIEVPSAGASAGGTGGVAACATQQADALVERQPIDIIVTIDNSSSMQDEIDAVARSINSSFVNILQTSGVDYRVILVSRHEKMGRRTSICVTAPLSANMVCPPTPDVPAFTERFYQYSLEAGVGSLNSLALLVDTFDATMPDEFGLAPMGWGAWLRPNAKKVFLEITDDNSTRMTASAFIADITAKSPQFGTAAAPTFVFHSIIGIGEKPQATEPWLPSDPAQTSECGDNGAVENPGAVYQELSRATGGLRFPICQFTAFDVVFEKIADDVVSQAKIACEFAIPAPPAGRDLDLSKVAVSYEAGDGTGQKTFGQAKTVAECVADAFYIDTATNKIQLCPATCTSAQAGANPKIDVLFTCEPTFVDPPE